ncbi:MAG TPA: DUF11 domain-containing protein [Thermoanaerobaculia bacterium]|nr:DUF11 domain-containing protein [Thermoanaerobaculia bacterium]
MLHSSEGRNIAIRSCLAALLLCGTLAGVTAAPVRATTFDWSQVTWNPGDLSHTYTLADGTIVTFTVATAANGSFGTSPYKDGPPAPPGPMNQLGTLLDLGVIFDPNSNQGMSPVILTLTLSPPRTGVRFEISDIDTSGSGAQLRIDQVVVACNGAAPSSLTAKTATSIFSITGGNTATADGIHSVDSTSDDGTAKVDCGSGSVGTAQITYNETSGVFDPPGRGIGVFGAFQFDTPDADLAITKTDGVTNAIPGQSVTYTITATNAGPNPAPGATVADTFPAACTSVTWTCAGAGGGTCTAAGSGSLNDTVNLPVGGSVTYTATCAVSAAATGSLANTATVAPPAAINDPTPGNNSATDTDTLIPQADLAITKTDGVTSALPGQSVTYTITAANAGPSPAPGSTVADTFPAACTSVTWTCAGAGGGTCTAAGSGNLNDTVNLPAGGSVTYTATCAISPTATGSLVNTATVAPPPGINDPTPGNNSATDTDTLTPQADLAITKTDGVTSVIPGQSVTYTLTASNAGPSSAPGSTVADTFPAACTSVTWTCAGAGGGTCTATGSGNLNDTVNLPVGASVTYTATCAISATATGSLTNTATVAPPQGINDPTPGNNSATDTDTLTTGASVSGTKSVNGTTFQIGSLVTYTIVLTNSGGAPQGNNPGDEFSDTLPAQLALFSATATSGTAVATTGTNTVTWNGAIPVGGSVTITINATLLSGAPGATISNQGWIFYDSNGDGVNDKTRPTDDPVIVGPGDPTSFQITQGPAEIPTLSEIGLLALGFALLLAGMSVLRRKRATR